MKTKNFAFLLLMCPIGLWAQNGTYRVQHSSGSMTYPISRMIENAMRSGTLSITAENEQAADPSQALAELDTATFVEVLTDKVIEKYGADAAPLFAEIDQVVIDDSTIVISNKLGEQVTVLRVAKRDGSGGVWRFHTTDRKVITLRKISRKEGFVLKIPGYDDIRLKTI